VRCGKRVLLVRARKAVGFTQEEAAYRLGVDRSTIARWESGETEPLPWLRPKLAKLLVVTLARLEELLAVDTQTDPSAAEAGDGLDLDERARAQVTVQQLAAVTPLRPDRASPMSRARDDSQPVLVTGAPGGSSEEMMRRELLRLFSMIGVLLTMPDTDEQLDQLDHLSTAAGQFNDLTIDDYAALNEHLWRVFVLSKSKGAVLPLVRDQFEALIFCLSRSRGISTHRLLCALASELLQLAGEIFFDANKYSDAAYCYTLAATASKEADAFDLWACAMTRHAFVEIYEQRFDKALPMLELAARLARRGDGALPTRYWVSSVQAQAFAGLGELAACQRTLDAAEQVRELSGDASNGGWLRFDDSRLAEERGACYVQLRRPDLAESVLAGTLRQNLSARRRASVLTDLAIIGLQRGDVDRLIIHAEAALEIARRTGSGFISRKLQGLRDHLAPLLGNSRARRLDQQIMVISRNFEP